MTDSRRENGILPGLGTVAGIVVAVLLWAAVEQFVPSGPRYLVAQGMLFAVSTFLCNVIDGVLRPQVWTWKRRIRWSADFSLGILLIWCAGAVGHLMSGRRGAAIGFLIMFAIVFLAERILKRQRLCDKTNSLKV